MHYSLGFLRRGYRWAKRSLYQALPFIITALVLVFSSMKKKKNSGQPAGLGLNYFREER